MLGKHLHQKIIFGLDLRQLITMQQVLEVAIMALPTPTTWPKYKPE